MRILLTFLVDNTKGKLELNFNLQTILWSSFLVLGIFIHCVWIFSSKLSFLLICELTMIYSIGALSRTDEPPYEGDERIVNTYI